MLNQGFSLYAKRRLETGGFDGFEFDVPKLPWLVRRVALCSLSSSLGNELGFRELRHRPF